MRGETDKWSATTQCTDCGDWWLWGVKDNLNFICGKCKEVDALHNHDCHLSAEDGCITCEKAYV